MAERDYVIYKNGVQITVDAALELDEDGWDFLYVPMGTRTLSNPMFVVGALTHLRDTNQIDSFVFTGTMPELPYEEGVDY